MTLLALCAASNYPGTGHALSGCHNDALDWAQALTGHGAEVTTLIDHQASRAAILDALGGMLGRLRRGDTGALFWSGHGTSTVDLDKDEVDGRDEAVCPDDFGSQGLITDDNLAELADRRAAGSHFVIVADSCFAGGMNRFAAPLTPGKAEHHLARYLPPEYVYTARRDGGDQKIQAVHSILAAQRYLTPAPVARRLRGPAGTVSLTGSDNRSYAYDAWFAGRPNGAFTRVAIDALADGMTYRSWFSAIRGRLPSADYVQFPQLDGPASQKRLRVFAGG